MKKRAMDRRAHAAELGVSVNAVYVNASRPLARVREQYAELAETLSQP